MKPFVKYTLYKKLATSLLAYSLLCIVPMYAGNPDSEDFYERLGVEENATKKEMKKAYNKLSRKWHPDKWVGAKEDEKKEASKKFIKIEEAYKVLIDPDKRQQYDLTKEVTSLNEKTEEESTTILFDMLDEYKNYPNWINPIDSKPLLFRLYEENVKALATLFGIPLNVGNIQLDRVEKMKICFDALASSINTPYQGQTLLLYLTKEKNLTMLLQIINLHSRFLISSTNSSNPLSLIYLNLNYKDQDGKTVIDYLEDISLDNYFVLSNKPNNSNDELGVLRQGFLNSLKNIKNLDYQIQTVIENQSRNFPMLAQRIIKQAQDITGIKTMPRQRNYLGYVSVLLFVVGSFWLFKQKKAKSKVKKQ